MAVEFERKSAKKGHVGVALLNRPQVLNSLNLQMCKDMAETFYEWKNKTSVIFIHGNGEKGFCAGGDVKFLRENIIKSQKIPAAFQYVIDFFCYEYLNDYQLSQINQPLIGWGSGVTMGGGLGVLQGCSYRIATENSLFAMPEISIGLYPDVGASKFLNKVPPGVGLFLALSGARFNARQAMQIGLIDMILPESKRGHVIDRLIKTEWSEAIEENHQKTLQILREFSLPYEDNNDFQKEIDLLADIDDGHSVLDVLEKLQEIATQSEWVKSNIDRAIKGSPTSLHVIWANLKRCRDLPLRDVFIHEYDLSIQFSKHHDFPEGVRSVLVDKDNTPHWEYKNLHDVPLELIAKIMSSPFNKDEPHPFLNILKKFSL